MQRTSSLLIGLLVVLAGANCARRDWVSDLLVLTDVTGTWEGSMRGRGAGGGMSQPPAPITMVLQQNGPNVTGDLSWSKGHGRVEGVVTGEVLTFSVGIRGELAVDGDEMWGTIDDRLFASTVHWCRPCHLRFRRESSSVPSLSAPPARREP